VDGRCEPFVPVNKNVRLESNKLVQKSRQCIHETVLHGLKLTWAPFRWSIYESVSRLAAALRCALAVALGPLNRRDGSALHHVRVRRGHLLARLRRFHRFRWQDDLSDQLAQQTICTVACDLCVGIGPTCANSVNQLVTEHLGDTGALDRSLWPALDRASYGVDLTLLEQDFDDALPDLGASGSRNLDRGTHADQ